MASEASENQNRSHCCFLEWVKLQELDLAELVNALDDDNNEEKLSRLVEKNMEHFEQYANKRSLLARSQGVYPLLSPSWFTSFENSLLWIGGCRPSLLIRLVYALCGSEIESQLAESFNEMSNGKLGELSCRQLTMVNCLQGKTIREEEKLSSKLASLQEEIGDCPLALIANKASKVGELNRDADKALWNHAKAMASMLEEADKLRLRTLEDLIVILTPTQAVAFLASSKKLHLSVLEWGNKKAHQNGEDNN